MLTESDHKSSEGEDFLGLVCATIRCPIFIKSYIYIYSLKASKDLKKMQTLLLKSHDYLRSAVKRRKKKGQKELKLMFMKKYTQGGQINAIDHMGGAGDAKISHLQNCSVQIFRSNTAGILQFFKK